MDWLWRGNPRHSAAGASVFLAARWADELPTLSGMLERMVTVRRRCMPPPTVSIPPGRAASLNATPRNPLAMFLASCRRSCWRCCSDAVVRIVYSRSKASTRHCQCRNLWGCGR